MNDTNNNSIILTDIENNIGKIYLVCNRTHGYYTILPLANPSFLSFIEKLYKDIDVDDYELNYKYLVESSLKNKIVGYLHTIFKSNTLTFAMNNKINSSNDFFMYLNQLLVNHILNQTLLDNFKLLENSNFHDDKQTIKLQPKSEEEKCKNNYWDIRDQCNKSTRLNENFLNIDNKLTQNIHKDINSKDIKPIEKILPYNHYDTVLDNDSSVIPSCQPMLTAYYSWKTDDNNKNIDNLNKCAIVYCVSQSIGIFIENENIIHVEYLIKNFKDFELVKTYTKLDKSEVENIKNYFHKRYFESNETLLKKINSFESLFDINNDKKNDIVNNEIEGFIRERYTFDNDPKNIMKANEILNALMLELQYYNKDKMKLSKELSGILLNMGLKKKRMADGIYYYGIVPKVSLIMTSETTDEKFKKSVEEHKLNSVSENIDTAITLQSSSIKS